MATIGLMVPSAFAAGAIESSYPNEPEPKKVIESSEYKKLKKFFPDYYNYIPEQTIDDGRVIVITAAIDKGDEILGSVGFTKWSDPDTTWQEFYRQKDSSSLINIRDHIPDLPPTSCFEGLYPIAYTTQFKVVLCMKDDVLIYVMTNDGEHRATMKQILKKMDGELSILNMVAEPEPNPICGDGTVFKNGQCVIEERGGGCLIATAAFGSEMAPQVQFLREIRDNTIMTTQSGTAFMTGFNQFYYSFSPAVADYERENPVFKEAVKVTLTPLLTSLTLLNYVEIDSEEEMLGYGIGIILLNIGMYFVAPAALIIALKKRFL